MPGANLGYQVVAKCPSASHDPELRKKCETPKLEESSPFVQGEDGWTYKNMDCALCNAVSNWTAWSTGLSCTNATLELIQARIEGGNYTFSHKEREMIRNNCSVKMTPPKAAERFPCRIALECKDTTNSDYSKCLSYKQQVYSLFPPLTYRNPHCARCSNAFLVMFSLFNHFHGTEGDTSLAILFDFSKASQIYGSGIDERSQSCRAGELYDYEQSSCRKQQISSHIPHMNWTCEFMNETFHNSSVVVFKNRSIFVPAHRRTYDTGHYFWNEGNGNLTVCGNFTRKFLKSGKIVTLYTKAEHYLTVIGYTSSIFAVLVVLLTYSMFNELRTLPGKIVMNLAVALLLSQVVFLVETFQNIPDRSCAAITIILHFLYLASFCWMNVIAFDVAKTFGKNGKYSLIFLPDDE